MLYISKTKRLAFDLETALQLDDANADERGCAFIDIAVCVAGLRIHRSGRNIRSSFRPSRSARAAGKWILASPESRTGGRNNIEHGGDYGTPARLFSLAGLYCPRHPTPSTV